MIDRGCILRGTPLLFVVVLLLFFADGPSSEALVRSIARQCHAFILVHFRGQ